MPTEKGKRLILGGVGVFAALAVTLPLLPRVTTLAAPYTGVMRVPLPNYTRVEMPGSRTESLAGGTSELPVTPAISSKEGTEEALAAAVGDMPPGAVPQARAAPGNIIPVRFDLQSPGLGDEVVGGDEIVVRKSVRIGAREIGKLPIHVDSRSRLLVRTGDLRNVLEKAGHEDKLGEAATGNQLRTLADLRKDGLDLRYDPNSDSVVLTIG